MSLRFDGQTVVITGVGRGLGRCFALHFASSGANVVVHDHGHNKAADVQSIVQEIHRGGGKALGCTDCPDAIVEAAIKTFGRVDILINNSGAQGVPAWDKTKQADWDSVLRDNFGVAFKTTRAAWPGFRQQKNGRILHTGTVVENGNSYDSPLLSAATYGELGFVQTLASEGAKYNILAFALSIPKHTRSDELELTDRLVQSAAALVHPSNKLGSGHMYQVVGHRLRKLRWQESSGSLLNSDSSLSTGALLDTWSQTNDFSRPGYSPGPGKIIDKVMAMAVEARKLEPMMRGDDASFDGRVVLVTGAGAGLGRAYSLYFARLGATVILNDLKDPSAVANEIRKAGGKVSVVVGSVSHGDRIVEEAVQAHGRIDVVINNAGFIRDKTIAKLTDAMWDSVLDVHLTGPFKITKAVWPLFQAQGYGRIVNVSSPVGIYGNHGQSNYSLAKCAIIGFSEALAREGAAHNILINTVAPVAATAGPGSVFDGGSNDALPEHCAPFVALLCSDKVSFPNTGAVFQIGGGWHSRTRQQANEGVELRSGDWQTKFQKLSEFGELVSYPEDEGDDLRSMSRQKEPGQRSGSQHSSKPML